MSKQTILEALARARGAGTAAAVVAGVACGIALAVPRGSAQHAAGAAAQDVAPDLYARDCSGCHGRDAQGTSLAPPLTGAGAAGAYFYLSTGRMPLADPDADVRRGPPAYDQPTMRAIAAHVQELAGGPDVPDVDPARGDPAAGASLYAVHCSACHGATLIGGALSHGEIVPGLQRASALEIGTSLLAGPGAMPVLSPPLDGEEIDSIARYVRDIRDVDPGGAPIGRVGPVAEGFVAWAALAVLLLVCRWIGTRVSDREAA